MLEWCEMGGLKVIKEVGCRFVCFDLWNILGVLVRRKGLWNEIPVEKV